MRLTSESQGVLRDSDSVSASRRDFLRLACGTLAAGTAPARLWGAVPGGRKAIIVTFGGGARDDETFALEGQRNIPHLIQELVPQGTFFTQVVNRGILGHYVATASIATGRYQTFNNFVAQPPPAPTVFEYFRKHARRPASDAWVIAPSNGFRLMGWSGNREYGPRYGAGVILPKHLLLSSGAPADFTHLLQDSYEMAGSVSTADVDRDLNLQQLSTILRLSVDEFRRNTAGLASPDELSLYVAGQLMQVAAPSMLFLTLHDMDVAHTGAFSLYLEGIQRSDRICARLWQMVQSNPEYKDRTTLLIMPDFGRDADGDPGGNGFQHHRTGSPVARTTWLLALGPGVRQNATVDRLVESIDLVPTVGKRLGFDTPLAGGHPIAELA